MSSATDKQIEALKRAARHYRRTSLRHGRFVHGRAVALPATVDRVTKQLRHAERNLMFRAECYAYAEAKKNGGTP